LRWGRMVKDLVQSEDDHDQASAELGARLAAFVKGDPVPNVWADDLEPMFRRFHDQITEAMLALTPDEPGATERLWVLKGELQSLHKWAKAIDTSINIGAGALERMALRNLRLAAAADVAREGVSKSG